MAEDALLRVDHAEGDPELGIEQRCVRFDRVKLSGQAGEDDHGKLQPLGLVHGHDADDVLLIAQGLGGPAVIRAGAQVCALQEIIQGAALGSLLRQQAQVGLPGSAVLRRAGGVVDAGFVQQQADEDVQGHPAAEEAPAVESGKQVGGFDADRRVRCGGSSHEDLVIGRRGRRVADPDGRQLLGAEAEAGNAADGHQREVLVRVVDHPEQVHHILDLAQVVILRVRVRIEGNAGLAEGVRVDGGVGGRVAQQDHDVPVPVAGPGRQRRIALLHQGPDPLGNKAGFPLGACGDALLLPRILVGRDQQPQLRFRAGGRFRAGAQGGAVVIFDLQRLAVHDHGEDLVDGVEDVPGGAEVLLQQDLTLRAAWFNGKTLVLVHEQRRLGLAKAVDALLDVADHEELVPPVQRLDDLLLDGADVLVLVDEQHIILTGELPGDGFLPQEGQAAVLQVVVVQDAAFELQRLVPVLDVPHQAAEAPRHAGGQPFIRDSLAVVPGQRIDGVLHLLLPAVAGVGIALLGVLVVHIVLFAARHDVEFDRPASQRALLRGAQVVMPQIAVLDQDILIACWGQRIAEQRLALIQGFPRLAQPFGGQPHQRLENGHLRKRPLIGRRDPVGPIPGVRHGQQEAAGALSHGRDVLRRGAVEQVGLVVCRMLIGRFHRFIAGAVQQARERRVVADMRLGVQTEQLKVPADHRLAEGMQRGDLGAGKPLLLPVQVRVCALPVKGLGDALPHLGCRGAGEGDDQEAGDIAPAAQGAQHPGDEDGRLAGARSGADQQRRRSVLDGRQLVFSPTHRHRLCFRDRFDLTQRALGQGGDRHAAAGRFAGEIAGIDLVEHGEIRHIPEVAGRLDDALHRDAGGVEDGRDIPACLVGLRFDTVGQGAGGRIDRDLAGGEKQAVCQVSLAVGADGRGRGGCLNAFHGRIPPVV